MTTTLDTAAHGARVALAATIATVRRFGRVLHAIIVVTRRHAPRWLVVVLGIALAIPGPVDELIVLAIIGVLVAVKPVMRAAMVAGVSAAWNGAI